MDELAVALGASPILPPPADPQREWLAIAVVPGGVLTLSARLRPSVPMPDLMSWRVAIRVPGALPIGPRRDAVEIEGSVFFDAPVPAQEGLARLVNVLLLARAVTP